MMMSKRRFLKVGLGSTAAAFFAPLLQPSLSARSFNLPQTYLESSIHNYWMKLSYNHGGESRQTRRRLGVALRNLGAIHGFGLGYSFVSSFDQAVEAAFRRSLVTGQKPGSLFALVQMLYDDFLFPQTGVRGGQILFGMLFSILRGRDGTALGEQVYQSYLAYREAALAHKNAYRTNPDPKAILAARLKRKALLMEWQQNLSDLVNLYARRELRLNPNFRMDTKMLEGFETAFVPIASAPPHLCIYRYGTHQVVSWKGGARLQQAHSLHGPWIDTHKSSPATFDGRPAHLFFRTVQPSS